MYISVSAFKFTLKLLKFTSKRRIITFTYIFLFYNYHLVSLKYRNVTPFKNILRLEDFSRIILNVSITKHHIKIFS